MLQAGPTFTYALDVMGRPVTMTSNQAAGTLGQNVVYNAADQITQMDRGGNGSVSETRTYNALLQLTSLSANHGGYSYGYTYSGTQNNGRIVQSTDAVAGQTINYTYDSLNRLSTATGTGWAESYTYDGFGNLTDKTPTAGSPPALHVAVNAANNRLVGYSYDANGNMAGMSGTSFTYDVANRIATVLPSGGGNEQYSYGPDNLRVWKLAADGTEELHFYGVLGERLGTYRIANNYGRGYKVFQGPINGYFAGKIIWSQLTDIGGGVVYGTGREVVQNRLGSVAGSYPNGTYYYPYGEDTGTPLLGDNFGTYYRDGTTGLDYARNRYYSPILGRFLSPDPYRASGGPADPGSWNRYAYVMDDPVNLSDPEGLVTVDPWLETFQIWNQFLIMWQGQVPQRRVLTDPPALTGAQDKAMLKKRILNLGNCTRILGPGVSTSDLWDVTKDIKYFNGSPDAPGSDRSQNAVSRNGNNTNLADTVQHDVADTLLGSNGKSIPYVVLGMDFYNDPSVSQPDVLLHEALHVALGLGGVGDKDLKTYLEQFGFVRGYGHTGGTDDITQWLKDNCPKQTTNGPAN